MIPIWIKIVLRGSNKKIGFVLWIAKAIGLEVEYLAGGG